MEYSPLLSILTAVFEIAAVYWALKSPGRKPIILTSATLLLLLASYQVLEVLICSSGLDARFLNRLAFIMITWLPPTGILLIAHLHTVKTRALYRYTGLMYTLAFIIVIWILLDKNFVTETVCTVVFARYANPMPRYIAYCVFFDTGLLSMVVLSTYGFKTIKDFHQRRLLKQILTGTLSFIIPSVITVMLISNRSGSMLSIMCHYALLLAIFITRLIYLERKQAEKLIENK